MNRTALALLLCVAPLCAASGAIGYVYARGVVRVDQAEVPETATVFEGSVIETGESAARIQVGAARVWLAQQSRARVFQDHAVLEKGLGQVESAREYRLQTPVVTAAAAAPGTVLRVMLAPDSSAVVMPLQGAARVENRSGVRVGNLEAGRAVRFSAAGSAAGEIRVSGCLLREHGAFTVTDQVTRVSVQVRGAAFERDLGYMVTVAGKADPAAPDGMPLVSVSTLERAGAAGCAPVVQVAQAAPQAHAPHVGGLFIAIVEGEGAVNNIRQRTAREPIVEVQDENHKPVAGALVVFALPNSGPSGTFANGLRTLTVTTDAQGRATGRGFKPNNQSGSFQIAVTASFAGQIAQAVIAETNAVAAAAAGGAAAGAAVEGMSTAAKVAIIGGVSAAAAVGGLAGAGAIFGGNSSTPASR